MSEVAPAPAPAPLILIGMMGSGKSTVGRYLARLAGLEFIDCDRELESRSGATINTMFELEGEAGFRKREAALLDELTQRRGLVLATGGGAVLLEQNRESLRARGLVIYLETSLDELRRRLRHDKSRPLLQGVDVETRVAELLATRGPMYRSCAHLSFASGAANPKKMAQKILAAQVVADHLAQRV
jgi:shikimate kinase